MYKIRSLWFNSVVNGYGSLKVTGNSRPTIRKITYDILLAFHCSCPYLVPCPRHNL